MGDILNRIFKTEVIIHSHENKIKIILNFAYYKTQTWIICIIFNKEIEEYTEDIDLKS